MAEQTAIVADERLDAFVAGHTQIDGGLLAALSGDLSLDTATLGWTDIVDRARSESLQANLGLTLGLAPGSPPGVSLEGEIATTRMDGVTRATVGPGEIVVRDEEAQTQDLAALNRDLDAAQEVFRDEAAGVRFYVSDTAVRAAVEAGVAVLTAIGDALERAGEDAVAKAIRSGEIDPVDALRQLAENPACTPGGGRRGFLHGFPWLITSAHAASECVLTTVGGRQIPVSDIEACRTVLWRAAGTIAFSRVAQGELAAGFGAGVVLAGDDVLSLLASLPDADLRAMAVEAFNLGRAIAADPAGMAAIFGIEVVDAIQGEAYAMLAAVGREDYDAAGRALGRIVGHVAIGALTGGATAATVQAVPRLGAVVSRVLGSSASGIRVVGHYTPVNQGPLSTAIASTFRSGTYSEVVTTQPTTLYRVISDNGNPAGGFWTREPPRGSLQAIIDLGLDQNWGNTATRVVVMDVPAGTRLFEGVAAPQRGLVGGGSQIYFDPNLNPLDPNWIRQ